MNTLTKLKPSWILVVLALLFGSDGVFTAMAASPFNGTVTIDDPDDHAVAATDGATRKGAEGILFSSSAMQALPVLKQIPAYKNLPKELGARIQVWRQIVRTVLAEGGDPMAAAGSCEAYATKWIQRLAQNGYPLAYAQTSGMGDVIVDGKPRKQDKIHVFVADRGLCNGEGDDPSEIIIDPTFTQFFEPGECLFEDSRAEYLANGGTWDPKDILTRLPPVFVGTRANIITIYQAYRSRLRSAQTTGVDANTGKYEPASLASLHYSFKPNDALRTNLLLEP